MIFPELGLSAYAIDDLLFQDALLDKVERAGFDVLSARPALTKWDKGVLLARAVWGQVRRRLRETALSRVDGEVTVVVSVPASAS